MTTIAPVQKIATEGPRVARPRNVSRVVIEVVHETVGQINGHALRCKYGSDPLRGKAPIPTTQRFEIYIDRLPNWIAKLRTREQAEAYEDCKRMADMHVEQWKRENADALQGKTEAEVERYVYLHCHVGPGQFLPLKGYRTGLGSLLAVRIVSQLDESKTVDAEDFGALTEKEREEFVYAPPRTHDNASEQANAHLARVLERALGNVAASRGRGSKSNN